MRWTSLFLVSLSLTGAGLSSCGRPEPQSSAQSGLSPGRDDTMPMQAVAKSAAAALAETPPNERADPDPKPKVSPASFDCARASAGVEPVICGDPDLSALDREMARLYHLAEAEKPGDTLKRLQRGWLDSRNACASAGSAPDCLKAAYAGRIHDLKLSYAAARAPGGLSEGPQVWRCDDDVRLNVLYLNVYKPLMLIDASAGQVLLSRADSASGQRYAAGGYEFWQKGETASYARMGLPVTTCRRAEGAGK
ncbi:MAG: MliC family protein [Asticcacaulis sp.]